MCGVPIVTNDDILSCACLYTAVDDLYYCLLLHNDEDEDDISIDNT